MADPLIEFLRKKLGPGLTAGFNPNAPTPTPDVGALVNSATPRAPLDTTGARELLRPAIAAPLENMSFAVNPQAATTSVPEVAGKKGKLQMSGGTAAGSFQPKDYSRDPEGRDLRDYQIQQSQKDKKWYDWLKPVMAGALQGVATAGRNPYAGWQDVLAGAVGGGATAGIANKLNPDAGSAIMYEMFRGPQFRAERERQQATDQTEHQRRMAQAQEELTAMRIKDEQAQAQARQMPRYTEVTGGMFDPATREFIRNPFAVTKPPATEQPIRVGDSLVVRDPQTGQLVEAFRAPNADKQPSFSERQRQAEYEADSAEGSVEEIAQSSLQGRLDSLRQRLPEAMRKILDSGKVSEFGVERDATPMEAQAATTLWQKMQDDELNRIRKETAGIRRSKLGGQLGGRNQPGQAAAPSGTGTRRVLGDLVKRHFERK